MDNEQKLLLTVAEAAVKLGVGRSFLYGLVMRGDIESCKLGRARRIPLTAIQDFIARQLQEPDDGLSA